MKPVLSPLLLALVLLPVLAGAAEVDPSTLYTLSTEGSSTSLPAGGKGVFVLTIVPKPGAHISPETPFKLELTGERVTPAQTRLKLADAVSTAPAGQPPVPRFEVPLTAGAAGEGKVSARLTFFICTDKLCARQVRTVEVPLSIR